MSTPERLPFHLRIRRRRERLGLTGQELAQRAEISPPYVSLIERGIKVPDEGVAVALAKALDDDPELYRAWVWAARYGDYAKAYESATRIHRISSDPRLRAQLALGHEVSPEPEPVPPPRISAAPAPSVGVSGVRAADASRTPDGPDLVIPLLDPGGDPEHQGDKHKAIRIDRALLPPDAETGRLVALRVEEQSGERVGGVLAPGDVAVLSRWPRRIVPDRIYAVRHHGRVILSRLLFKGNALLLLPPEGRSDFEVVDVESASQALERVVGVVVLTIRRWTAP